MSKFSVKRPYTVLIAVIAILVLGVVAFTGMTPDLLPSMELPYVVLMTPYPGASPERVEAEVTKPLEQSMATLENIEAISSTSSDNYATIILEFTDDVNMEAITVDILQKISQVQGAWGDTIGTPLILKLNPDMLPVVVAAVEREGMDTIELSAFVDEVLLNKLEGTSGVASVTAQGLVERQVNVVLNQGKIDVSNQIVADAIDQQFAEAIQELEDGKAELEDKLGDLEGGIKTLEGSIDELARKAAEGGAQLDEKQMELLQGKLALSQQLMIQRLALQELVTQEAPLLAQKQQLETQLAQLNGQKQQLETLLQVLNTYKSELAAGLENTADATQHAARLQQIEDDYTASLITEAERDALVEAENQAYNNAVAHLADMDTTLLGLGATGGTRTQQVDNAIADNTAATATITTAIATADAAMQQLNSLLGVIANGKAELQSGIAQAEGLLKQLEAGEIALNQAMVELDVMKTTTQFQLSNTSTQLNVGGAQLNMALTQVESGLEQVETAKENALKQADLNTLVTMDMVANILVAQNFTMPAGYVHQDGVDYLVRVGDAVTSPEELARLVLFDPGVDGVEPIRLQDVADVFVSDNLESLYAKINSADGILLSFNKQSVYATAEVSQNIADRFAGLEEEYEGLRFTNLMDQGDYIGIVVGSIMESLGFGAIFAILILFLFLKDIRPTFITLCSIPISVLFAIVLMYFSGITLNIISLSGLAVAVGMLVDNSVVVIENIYRLRGKGYSAIQAAVSGAAQVAGAITSSTLTTVCVFLPIVFVQGITRELFTDMALTLGYALMASLIVALTLVPAMSSRMLKKAEPKDGRLMARMLGGYQKSLNWALGHRAIVLLATLALLVASAAGVMVRGFTLMPDMDMPQLTVTVRMPDETPFEDTKEMSDEVMRRILEIDGVETVGAIAGGNNVMGSFVGLGGGSSGGDATTVTLYVMVDEKGSLSGKQVGEEIVNRTQDLDARISASNTVSMNQVLGGGSGITINLYGNNQDTLFEEARAIAGVLEGVQGTTNVRNGIGETDPEIRFVVNKDKAMEHGLTVAQVFMEINKALTTTSSSTTISWQGGNYDVLIAKPDDVALTPTYIQYYQFPVTDRITGEESMVSIRDVADVIETETATSIERNDQRRFLTITAGIAEGHNVSIVTGAAQRALQNHSLPAGMSMEFAGENETIMESFVELFKMLALGVLLVYLIMVAQFQSLKNPFIVMFTIPLAFTGGFLALLITGFELSVIALIGFVMLVGIIVNNGIVLVDYVNQLRLEGVEKHAALLEAGATRMRPILMTSITTILGLSVMAVGSGTGSELMQPVAIVCIGGLTYATLMTLYVVPVIYDLLNRKEITAISDEELEIVED